MEEKEEMKNKKKEIVYRNFKKYIEVKIEEKNIKKEKKEAEGEIFDSLMVLKNLSIVQQESPLSADFIFEKLLVNSKKLKPYFAEMILLYRQGDEKMAFEIFTKKIGTRHSRTFGNILAKLDKINPAEIVSQVKALQEILEDERITKEAKKASRNGVITTICAAVTIFALLLNFTVVVVFMDTMKILEGIF